MHPVAPKSRPKLLTLLCIGSAIFGSLWIIMLLAIIVFSVKGRVPAGLFPVLAVGYSQAGYLFMIALLLLALLGLTGVLLMWQMNKNGFYLYTAAKACIYYLPVMFVGNNHLTFIGLLLTSAPIIMYGVQFVNIRKKI